MGRIKKANADKTQQGSNRWEGPMQSYVFFCFCFFLFSLLFSFLFLFVPRLVIRKIIFLSVVCIFQSNADNS